MNEIPREHRWISIKRKHGGSLLAFNKPFSPTQCGTSLNGLPGRRSAWLSCSSLDTSDRYQAAHGAAGALLGGRTLRHQRLKAGPGSLQTQRRRRWGRESLGWCGGGWSGRKRFKDLLYNERTARYGGIKASFVRPRLPVCHRQGTPWPTASSFRLSAFYRVIHSYRAVKGNRYLYYTRPTFPSTTIPRR